MIPFRHVLVATAIAATVATSAGCSKTEPAGSTAEPPPEIPPITKVETKRGLDACQALIERACRCAATVNSLVSTCESAKNIPRALEMAVAAGNSPGLERHTKARLQLEARRIMSGCFEDNNKIDPAICPQKAP